MKKQIVVCDVCQDPLREVSHYRVENDMGVVDLDLCEEHAAPILTVLREADAQMTQRARRSRRAKVLTLEEIEALRRNGGE